MKKLMIGCGGLIALLVLTVLGIAIYGFTLPEEHSAEHTLTIYAPPETVYAVIRDVDALPEWMPGVNAVTIDDEDENGLRTFTEDADFGSVTFTEIEAVPPTLLVVEVAEAEGWGGTWTYELEPIENGTNVTIREDGFIDNPIFRVISKFVGYDQTLRAVAAALQQRVQSL